MWANTCCSHNRHIEAELVNEENALGMRRAAVRRVKFELGISDLEVDDLQVIAKILYKADANEEFSEYEMDYIIIS